MTISGDYNLYPKYNLYQYQQQGVFNPEQTKAYPLNGYNAAAGKQAGVDSYMPTSAMGAQEFSKEPSAIEKFFSAIFGFLGTSSTEEIEKATEAIELLSALKEIESGGIDKGYQMHQAMKEDPTTQKYAKYDRELYALRDENTLALA